MMVSIPIYEAPRPVFNNSVNVEVRYVVVRGNGDVKHFEALSSSYSTDVWSPIVTKTSISPSNPKIDIPLDLLSALRLGLVTFEELMLPEAARAFINMIK